MYASHKYAFFIVLQNYRGFDPKASDQKFAVPGFRHHEVN
jgi:hypothetical protein